MTLRSLCWFSFSLILFSGYPCTHASEVPASLALPDVPESYLSFPWTNSQGLSSDEVEALPAPDLGPFAQGAQLKVSPSNQRNPNVWEANSPFAGFLGPSNDSHWIQFSIPESSTPVFHYLGFYLPTEAVASLNIVTTNRQTLFSSVIGPGVIGPLFLPSGEYLIQVSTRGPRNFPYRLEWLPTQPVEDNILPQPFGELIVSQPVNEGTTILRLPSVQGPSAAYFSFEPESNDKIWALRVETAGEELRTTHMTAQGHQISQIRTGTTQDLRDLHLGPGKHFFKVRGEGVGEIVTITFTPERELLAEEGIEIPEGTLMRGPNSNMSLSQVLKSGDKWVARPSHEEDSIWFRTFNPSTYPERYRLTLQSPKDQTFFFRTPFANFEIPAGETVVEEFWLFPGYDYFSLEPRSSGQHFFTFQWERLNPLEPVFPRRPFHTVHTLQPIPETGHIVADFSIYQNNAYFRLPAEWSGSEVYLTAFEPLTGMVGLRDVLSGRQLGSFPRAAPGEPVSISLPEGNEFTIIQIRNDPIDLVIGREPVTERPSLPEFAAVEITVDLPEPQVAAFWPYGQKIPFSLELKSRSSQTGSFNLKGRVAYAGASIEWEGTVPTELTLEANGTKELSGMIVLPKDLRDDLPLYVDFVAGAGAKTVEITAHPLQRPLNSFRFTEIPEMFLGSINVAAQRFGAEALPYRNLLQQTLNEMRPIRRSPPFRLGQDYRVTLPGESTYDLIGVSFNPFGTEQKDRRIADFRIETSLDGESFSPALEDTVTPVARDQFFPFPEPVAARFVRIIPLTTADGSASNTVEIGAFQALVAPQQNPIAPEGFNLADNKLGGHLVWSKPLQTYNNVLDAEGRSQTFTFREGDSLPEYFDWVIGFHHNRAARINFIGWDLVPRSDQDLPGRSVIIEASVDSPLGPWEEIATVSLPEDGSLQLPLEESPWVRFLRFRIPSSEEQLRYALPVNLVVREKAVSDSYFSILGQYGFGLPVGPYEFSQPFVAPEFPEDLSGLPNKTMETALPLTSDSPVAGMVSIGEHESWYHLQWDSADDFITITVQGQPDLDFRAHLVGRGGQPLDLDRRESSSAITFEGWPETNEAWLHLAEPPRSIVFSWDQSGSMGPYIDALYTALFNFIAQINPATEVIRMLAFDTEPVFIDQDWSSDTVEIRQILQNYNRAANSSNSETNLIYILGHLGRRDGTRAIIHLTDAETFSYAATADLWNSLEDVRPRIFTVETSSGGSEWTQDLMQDWAMVNRGHYSYMRDVAEVEVAFARASAWLRRPKGYEVSFQTEEIEPPPPPEPGTFELTAESAQTSGYLYIIFDASGSMRAPMDGVMKLDIAKDAVRQIVSNLPDDTQIAFRAYGHSRRAIEPGADQDTELLMPFSPLNAGTRAELEARLSRVRPLGRTPLALSLDETRNDIRGVRDPATVVLLTDGGEDTQERRDPIDAAAAYADLSGVELVIVGFDINRPAWTMQLEGMAAASGARYLTADSASDLNLSMEEATGAQAARFEILDAGGNSVAQGQAEQPVSLPPGDYTVVIQREGTTFRENIRVLSGSTTRLSMDRILNRP